MDVYEYDGGDRALRAASRRRPSPGILAAVPPEGRDPIRIGLQYLQTSRLMGVDFVLRHPPRVRALDPERPPVPPAVPGQLTFGSAAAPPAELDPRRKEAALEELRRRHEGQCPHCTRATAHTRIVFGEGDPDARLMFVGEAPGEEEDRTGRPFVGRAGRKLDEMIRAMGLERQQVYIANLLKSRPPDNRTPLPDEVDGCAPYLAEQIAIIRPEVLVALGAPAARWLLKTAEGITRLRGQWRAYTDGALTIPAMATFHPAFLLRRYTLDTRSKVWSDLQEVLRFLAGRPPRAREGGAG
jgi:DNA polymerase